MSRPRYQLSREFPKNIQTSAPKARYGPNGNLGRPDAPADQERGQSDERTEQRTRKNAEQNRAPSQERADGREKFQVAASHRFARNLKFAHHAGDLLQLVESDFFSLDRDPVVMKSQIVFPKERPSTTASSQCKISRSLSREK